MPNKLDADSWARVIARAWRDEAFRSQLLSEPRSALMTMGMDIPDGVAIRVVENTADSAYLVLPAPPAEQQLSADQIHKLSTNATVEFTNCTKHIPVC